VFIYNFVPLDINIDEFIVSITESNAGIEGKKFQLFVRYGKSSCSVFGTTAL
jgi:hypothetical protein